MIKTGAIQNKKPGVSTWTVLKVTLAVLALLFASSCIDDYWPEITDYQHVLVVDGMITSGPGPFEVRLSLTTHVNNPQYEPLKGCEVKVLDDLGQVIPFNESAEGTYVSPGTGEQGVAGRAYRISITTPDGQMYASELEPLLPPTSIDSLYPVLETKKPPGYSYDLVGYQFYVDTRDAGDAATYYLWKLQQTYEYNADFFIHFIYSGSTEPFSPIDSLYTCYITEDIHDILVFGTAGLSTPNLDKYPLKYVSTETRALSVRYSLLATQLTIGEKAYRFWRDVAEQNAGETSLYTQQLYQIRGNVKNISDDREPVLGYFTVAGKDSKRIFTNRPQEVIDFNYPVCVLGEGDYDAYKYIFWTPKVTWPLYVVRDENGNRALPQKICTDCRKRGGVLDKPEFWIDE